MAAEAHRAPHRVPYIKGVSLAVAAAETLPADALATPGSASVQVIHTTDLHGEERKPAPPVVLVPRAA